MVAFSIGLWRSHVPLRIDRVIVLPTRHGCHRNSCVPDAGRVGEFVKRHITPVTPAPDADPIRCHVGLFLEPVHRGLLIREFDTAQMILDETLLGMAEGARHAIVSLKYEKPFAVQTQVINDPRVPAAAHECGDIRAAILIHDDGISAAWIEVRGVVEFCIDPNPGIRGWNPDEMGSFEVQIRGQAATCKHPVRMTPHRSYGQDWRMCGSGLGQEQVTCMR